MRKRQKKYYACLAYNSTFKIESNTFFRNISKFLPDYTVSHPSYNIHSHYSEILMNEEFSGSAVA
jgi:hypothetical protein